MPHLSALENQLSHFYFYWERSNLQSLKLAQFEGRVGQRKIQLLFVKLKW